MIPQIASSYPNRTSSTKAIPASFVNTSIEHNNNNNNVYQGACCLPCTNP